MALEAHLYDTRLHEGLQGPELHLWSMDRQSEPLLVRVQEIPLYSVWMLPRALDQKQKRGLRSALLARAQGKFEVLDVKFSRGSRLCYYEGNRMYDFLLVRVESVEDLRRSRFSLKYPFFYQKGSSIKLVKCDPSIEAETRAMVNMGLRYAQCFRLESPTRPEEALRIAKVPEWVCRRKDVVPLSPEESFQVFPRVLSFDIETFSGNLKSFPEKYSTEDVNFLTTLSSRRVGGPPESEQHAVLLGDCEEVPGVCLHKVSSEAELLDKFQELIERLNPVIITGYNTMRYDWPYKAARMEMALKEWQNFSLLRDWETDMKDMSWSSSACGDVTLMFPNTPGRIYLDMFEIVKRNFNFTKYSLDFVASSILGKSKEDMPYKEMFRIYAASRGAGAGPEERAALARVVSYGRTDATLPIELFEKMSIWTASVEMSNVVDVPIEKLDTRGQQLRVISQLYRFCQKRGVRIDCSPMGGKGYVGGHVGKPVPGLYHNVIVLDFASLYPSLVITYNICYSTLVPPNHVGKIKDRSKYHFVEWEEGPEGEEKVRKLHVFRRKPQGVLPGMLQSLLAERARIKGLLKKDEGNTILDKRQKALKVSANSVYGFLGVSEEKGVLPFAPAAECVTALGRRAILDTNELVRGWGAKVVYNDTDSVMIEMGRDAGPLAARGKEMAEEITSFLRKRFLGEREAAEREGEVGLITMEYENTYLKLGCLSPKMYFATKAGRNGAVKPVFKGVMLARREDCVWAKGLYRRVLDHVMGGGGAEECLALVREGVSEILSGRVPRELLARNTSVRSGYKSTTCVQALFSRRLRESGRPLKSGERVSYFVLDNGKDKVGLKMFLEEELEEVDFPLDYFYYCKNVMNKVDTLFRAMYSREVLEAREARKRERLALLQQEFGAEGEKLRRRAGVWERAGWPSFRVGNSSFFQGVCEKPMASYVALLKKFPQGNSGAG